MPVSAAERVPAWSLAMTAMLSVQLGAAVSVGLLERIGAGGTAWLRILLAALGFLAPARPRFSRWSRRELRAPVLLGVATVGMLLGFQAAIALIPLGTVVAIELAAVCAVLAPFLPWMCELYALRRLSKAAFGTLMALEPAIAVVTGATLLDQAPDALQAVGTALVVVAGIAAERSGRRPAALRPAANSAVRCTAQGSSDVETGPGDDFSAPADVPADTAPHDEEVAARGT